MRDGPWWLVKDGDTVERFATGVAAFRRFNEISRTESEAPDQGETRVA